MKALFAMASVAAMVAVSPGLAQEKMDKMMDKMESMNCTDADMAAMDTKMKSMTDADKQKMAMGEMDMAKKMMANKDAHE